MYSKSFRGQPTGASFIPHDYRGNAFELAGTDPRPAPQPPEAAKAIFRTERGDGEKGCGCRSPECRDGECEREREVCECEKPHSKKPLGGLKLGAEEILLGALIIMLLNSHADDTLLLMLCVIFVAGL